MARNYSAVMALLTMLVVLARGIKEGAGIDGTLILALGWMSLMGAVGLIVGWIARETVDESVRNTIQAELVTFADKQSTESAEATP